MGGASGTYWGRERCIRLSVEAPEGNRPLVRPKPQWGDNIQVYLKNPLRGCWLDISGYGYGGLF